MANILIVGCGEIGSTLGYQLAAQGHRVTGLKRHPPAADKAIHYIAGDIADADTLQGLETGFDQAFFIVSADGRNEQIYREVYQTGLNNVLARFSGVPMLFVSSTSVYGQSRGEWVDEMSDAEPDDQNSRLIRQAEKQVLAANPDNIVVRFSGIYGPSRGHLVRLAAAKPAIQKTPPYYTNRIHQDDCVGVLAFLFTRRLAGAALDSCYLASDDDPAPMWEVVSWLAERQHCPPPVIKPVGDDVPMNKRCDNSRLKALGYRFLYASYKESYCWVERAQGLPR
ncbi:SDR family oxidoreductase [Methylomicrobium sp. Wu6]|uniref:SDR family oxidoreductase n=1 Tax=Methylomicrobium sp. Wu6 TaxID=3107928 RepID=UPI002DD6A83D|nr:SDR family oxidoreductase [Methylomicrobium sp. Wu6]MEC4749326.1 SDR family oxidoreductase [Methylomicrobium sp. Wu6]